MSYFGRGMDANLYWYDTQRTAVLRECYGKELAQRGHGVDRGPNLDEIPAAELQRMYPMPHRAQPNWSSRQDMDLVNRSLVNHRNGIMKQNYGKPDVTPKVGDLGVHPRSTRRLQALEEIRYSGLMEMAPSSSLKEKSTERLSSEASNSKSKTPTEGSAASAKVIPDEWKTVKIKALPPAYFTTNGSAYCDPAPFQKISGTTRPKQQNFRKKTDRSEYHEACLSLGRLQKML